MRSKAFKKRLVALGLAVLTLTATVPQRVWAASGDYGDTNYVASSTFVQVDYHDCQNPYDFYNQVMQKNNKKINQIFVVNNGSQLSWVVAAGNAPNASYLRFKTIGSRFIITGNGTSCKIVSHQTPKTLEFTKKLRKKYEVTITGYMI